MRRLRDEAGMTIMEVLTAATVGMIVLMAMFALLDGSVRMNTNVMRKTDAMQRGRLAMDVLTQELRSQVCLANLAGTAVRPGATADMVEFYSDFSEGDGVEPPTMRRLSFDPETGDIKTAIFMTDELEPVYDDFPEDPSQIQMRLENAARQLDEDGVEVPFLRYFAYEWVGNPATRAEATDELVPPLDGNEARRVARIDINFVAQPTGVEDRKKGVDLSDRIMARHSDPNLARWDPTNPSLPDPRCV
jgi:hypothetical protein